MAASTESLALAIQYHRGGALVQAEQLYREILQADPEHAEALQLLGALALQTGHSEAAVAYIRRAIARGAGSAFVYSNLGQAYRALGRLDEARACYQEVLRREPGHADAPFQLGALFHALGRLEEARACYEQALRLRPDRAEAYHRLGVLHQRLGRLDEARACYEQALRLQPNAAEIHCNLGVLFKAQGRLEEALLCLQHAVRLQPGLGSAHNNLGAVFQAQGLLDEAIACYQQALHLAPGHADAQNNLGTVFQHQGRPEEAVQCYQEALRLKPDFAEAHYNVANARVDQGRLEEAVRSFEEAVRWRPDFPEAFNNLGNALRDQGKVLEAARSFRHVLHLRPQFAAAHSNLLLALNYDPEADPAAVFAEHRRWGQLHGEVPRLPALLDRDRNPERRLRVGYVSPDLHRHPLVRYFEPVLAHHDPGQVEVTCYAEVAFPDAITARLQALAQGWRWTCGRSSAEFADLVRADGIDILVDLAGHTANHRLDIFARKPAPVQVTWLGYPNTTGLSTVDYRLTDAVMDPPGQPVLDTEELFRLPGGMCCFTIPEDAPPVAPLPAFQKGHLTFGSLHTLAKFNRHVFDLWCRVLQAVPTARLLMFRHTLVGETREYIRRQFTERGIAGERLELRQGTGAPGYLAIYDEIDVSLDVFPYTGGTTTCESLWMGAPMLSLAGVRPAARGSAMLLAIVGLTDWVVPTPEAYVALAQRCAQDLDALAAVRVGLRERMRRSLCDARRFTRGLEDAYRTMWRRWCAQA